ncbi:MAG: MGMT family protein [Candidatus Moranbacteria bacterium]|nr:MGMT family protein [Candidatus Moranbacteria bacterium]
MITDFEKKVYETLKKIPKGRVVSYGGLARACGKPGAFRAVGNALNKNPFAPEVPCHRVVRSDGLVGGFSSGAEKKVKLLKKEGVEVDKNGNVRDFGKRLFVIR